MLEGDILQQQEETKRQEEVREAAVRARGGRLTVRLLVSLVVLALAMVLRSQAGPAVRQTMAGAVGENVSLVAVFAELGESLRSLIIDKEPPTDTAETVHA